VRDALRAVDGLRDKYGESAVSLANGITGAFRERTHESLVQKKKRLPVVGYRLSAKPAQEPTNN